MKAFTLKDFIIMGGLGILAGLTTAKGATDEQARYKKGREPTPLQ